MLKDFLRNRVILIDLLAVLFGISSWISINGLWVELPLLVQELPEGWALPSYLSIIVQVANIGPITYSLLRSCGSSPLSPHMVIIPLLVLGCAASFALALTWDWVATLSSPHSVGLFISVFFLSLVDCTSSVLFLPYMGLFRSLYLNSYLIGEGMSGFVPSIAALAQGVSGNPVCTNMTLDNGTVVEEAVVGEPRFTTSNFFTFLLAMMAISLVAFLLLHYLPTARKERTGTSPSNANFSEVLQHSNEEPVEEEVGKTKPLYNTALLLTIQAAVCFLSNGALPSIQSYSCLPYGNTVYHLAVTLNAMANPLMAFLAFFMPCTQQGVVLSLALLGGALSTFILATALASPGMIAGLGVGGSLVVITWVVTGALFSYVKVKILTLRWPCLKRLLFQVSVAGMCRDSGLLFQCGALTQAGSAGGALIMFLLVNQVEKLLKISPFGFSNSYVNVPRSVCLRVTT